MGAITQAMARCCRERGVDIRVDTPVQEVLVERGRAVAVVTGSGQVLRARCVVSNLNPKLLFQQLLDPAVLPAPFLERIGHWHCASGTFRMNVALSELRFQRPAGTPRDQHHGAGIILARGWTTWIAPAGRTPVWLVAAADREMLIPRCWMNRWRRPAYVASLFCQQFAPELPDGSWDAHRGRWPIWSSRPSTAMPPTSAPRSGAADPQSA